MEVSGEIRAQAHRKLRLQMAQHRIRIRARHREEEPQAETLQEPLPISTYLMHGQ